MVDLPTFAERQADEARSLSAFQDLSLPGLRQNVADLLKLIGRTEGVFSTYALHDITHIDSMLSILDWLIPPSTKASLTRADWLMTVLSIYFHDLGLIVPREEYNNRTENRRFLGWLEGLGTSDDGRQYLARMRRMTAEEKDRFLFQEFIRKDHAIRISEWISGRPGATWSPEVQAITDGIALLLSALPTRLRYVVYRICKSHHEDNLDRRDLFPLTARYGNSSEEVANLQYAAVLLRSVDLLHVTKDRTPAIMYKIIGVTDPKGVEEWTRQSGTFAVGPHARLLREADPATAVIEISADFTEEAPFFALQEYIIYADEQIKLSSRWVQKSREEPDGESYSFPWHKVTGDVRLEGIPPRRLSFQLERKKLLQLLVGHTLYNDPTVAVRELLQNAIDAVRYREYLIRDNRGKAEEIQDDPADLGVWVTWEPAERYLEIEDSGIGMDLGVIENHLMRVGSSYYATPGFTEMNPGFNPISRFGIGILTCFMISEDIEILTAKKGKAYRLRMTSVFSDYLLREIEPEQIGSERISSFGTKIRLRIRETVDLATRHMEAIVRYWVLLPSCPVYFRLAGEAWDKIGWETEASYLVDKLSETRRSTFFEGSIEVLKKDVLEFQAVNPGQGEGSAVLAFPVRRTWTPERHFVTNLYDAQVVCIEGIRVASALPGLGESDSDPSGNRIAGILSVRGGAWLKTTVSRSELEVDEGYRLMAEACVRAVLAHVADEVRRIAQNSGNPVSQASEGGMWLVRTLETRVARGESRVSFNRLLKEIPLVVFEEDVRGSRSERRYLISIEQAGRLDVFWTIESRLIDSISVLSRGVGREISVSEFVEELAPNYEGLDFFPFIPDAERYESYLRETHHPELVNFSREEGRTATKWSPGVPSWVRTWGEAVRADEKFSEAVWRYMQEGERLEAALEVDYSESLGKVLKRSRGLNIVGLEGDDNGIDIVSAGTGVAVRDGSRIASVAREITSALEVELQSGELRAVATLLMGLYLIAARGSFMGQNQEYRHEKADRAWMLNVEDLRMVLGKERGTLLPGALKDLMPTEAQFSAKRYWRIWNEKDD